MLDLILTPSPAQGVFVRRQHTVKYNATSLTMVKKIAVVHILSPSIVDGYRKVTLKSHTFVQSSIIVIGLQCCEVTRQLGDSTDNTITMPPLQINSSTCSSVFFSVPLTIFRVFFFLFPFICLPVFRQEWDSANNMRYTTSLNRLLILISEENRRS